MFQYIGYEVRVVAVQSHPSKPYLTQVVNVTLKSVHHDKYEID